MSESEAFSSDLRRSLALHGCFAATSSVRMRCERSSRYCCAVESMHAGDREIKVGNVFGGASQIFSLAHRRMSDSGSIASMPPTLPLYVGGRLGSRKKKLVADEEEMEMV